MIYLSCKTHIKISCCTSSSKSEIGARRGCGVIPACPFAFFPFPCYFSCGSCCGSWPCTTRHRGRLLLINIKGIYEIQSSKEHHVKYGLYPWVMRGGNAAGTAATDGITLLQPFVEPFTLSKVRGLNRQLEGLLGLLTVIVSVLKYFTRTSEFDQKIVIFGCQCGKTT